MSLIEWQTRLNEHFAALTHKRAASGTPLPIFALEHGLDPDELKELKYDIKDHIAKRPPSTSDGLVWIVYAAEVGYDYQGYEYWQTFDEVTPGWTERGNRNWIRNRFIEFHEQFGGAIPTGIWAQWFTIICWPIHHAILPKDLQYHLARVLYRISGSFDANAMGSAQQLGEMVRAFSGDANSRFQQLTDEPLLVGQISLALLLQGQQDTESLILPQTLERIREDLQARSEAHEWLRQAARSARSARLLGLSSFPALTTEAGTPTTQGLRERAKALNLEPRLLLYPAQDSDWQVRLELPDFSQLLARFPELRGSLANSRAEVSGAKRQRLPPGQILYRNQRVPLAEWPSAEQPLLRLDNSPPGLRLLLQTDTLLSAGPIWLFKIANDNIARQVGSLSVRPGNEYILISKDEIGLCQPWLAETSVDCRGITAAILRLPKTITPEIANLLTRLGFNLARTIEVWPAGLVAAYWDGEGRGEWLTNDQPCIAIRSDFFVDSILIEVKDHEAEALRVDQLEAGNPVYVELPKFPIGHHRLEFTVRHGDEQVTGQIEIVIRAQQAWLPGGSVQGAFTIYVDPRIPSMEELWEGHASLEIYAPSTQDIECTVALLLNQGESPIVTKSLSLPMPRLETYTWQQFFNDKFKGDQQFQHEYDLARAMRIDLDAHDLGSFSLTCDRQFASVRLYFDRSPEGYKLRLIDDRGSAQAVALYHTKFDTPDVHRPIGELLDSINEDFTLDIPGEGGLYVAASEGLRSAMIAPALIPRSIGLDQLGRLLIEPRVTKVQRNHGTLIHLLKSLDSWSRARTPGDLVSTRNQDKVIQALAHGVFGVFCGAQWSNFEDSLTGAVSDRQLEVALTAISPTPRVRQIAADFIHESARIVRLDPHERARELAIFARYALSNARAGIRSSTNEDWLSEFTLRVASCPEGIIPWAVDNLEWGVRRLLDSPFLLRAARLLVLGVNMNCEIRSPKAGRIYPNWEWNNENPI